jgi:hypothetical protein
MQIFIALLLAALSQNAGGEQPVSPPEPTAAHADDVRCAGVFYAARGTLPKEDPRQPNIQASIDSIIQRIEGRISAGEMDEATVALEMQVATNEARSSFRERLDACLTDTTS